VGTINDLDIRGKRILEVGAQDINGSVRSEILERGPREYLGTDMVSGPGVDVVCRAERLVAEFGSETFDVVISTEVLEHVDDWRAAIRNFKGVLRPEGILIITTRSRGFQFHGFPADYWRFEPADMERIFADCTIEALERDQPESPGVFVKVRKPVMFSEVDLNQIDLFSIIRSRRINRTNVADRTAVRAACAAWAAAERYLPSRLRSGVRRLVRRATSNR
jgi:SAM-dependent methyltransferase